MAVSPKAKSVVLALLTVAGAVRFGLAAPSPQMIEAKVALESAVEKRLDAVLQRLLGSDNVMAIVNVQLIHENQAESADDVLPGVPTKDSPGGPAPLEISSNLVRRITAAVYLDKTATDADVSLVSGTVSRMLGLNADHGDTVSVERIAFQKPAPVKEQRKIPDGVVSLLWLIMAGVLLLLFQRFTGPFLAVIRDAVESLKARATRRDDREEGRETTEETQKTAAVAAPAGALEAAGRKRPFSFVEERDLPSLKLLIGGQEIETAAVVLQFLPPAMASDILAGLPVETRKEIVSMMSRPAVLDAEEVTGIEEMLKSQLDYLMGGEDKLLALIDSASPSLQSAILADVARSDPALSRRLSQRVVTLDDLPLLDEAGFKALGRVIPMQSLAAVIHSSPVLRQSVLARLHGGIAEWLSQEVEMMGDLPPAVLEERKKQVATALTKLVREGRVVIKRETSSAALADFEDVEEPAPAKTVPAPSEP